MADYRSLARQTADRYGIDPDIFERLVSAESSWRPDVVSSAGAIGLTQLMPSTAAGLGVDPFDPAQNLDGGARYLRQMLDMFGGDYSLAVAAYNAGPGAVQQYGGVPPFEETQNHVRKVLGDAQPMAGEAAPARVLPVASGVITQVFGPTDEPLDSGGTNKGIDIAVPTGTAVFSTVSGTVVAAGDQGDGWGISVKIQDDRGFIHNFGHLSGADVSVGQQVGQGQQVARSGNTGASTGPHLSYDVLSPDAGGFVDPSPWLGFPAAGDNRSGGGGVIGRDISELGGGVGGARAAAGGGASGVPGDAIDLSQYDLPSLPFSTSEYYQKLNRWNTLDSLLARYDTQNQQYQNDFEMWSSQWTDGLGGLLPGAPPPPEQPLMPLSEDELAEYDQLGGELDSWETAYDLGGADLDRLFTILDQYDARRPEMTDYENAVDAFDREYDIRTNARQMASDQFVEQNTNQQSAIENFNAAANSPLGHGMIRGMPAKSLRTYDDFFKSSMDTFRAGLPEVPNRPYPTPLPQGAFGTVAGYSSQTAAPPATGNRTFTGSRERLRGIGSSLGDTIRKIGAFGASGVKTPAPAAASPSGTARATFVDYDLGRVPSPSPSPAVATPAPPASRTALPTATPTPPRISGSILGVK